MVGVEAKVVNVNKVVETGTPTLVRINKQIGAKMNLYLNVSGYGILDNLPQDKSPSFKNHPTVAVVTIIPPNHNHK